MTTVSAGTRAVAFHHLQSSVADEYGTHVVVFYQISANDDRFGCQNELAECVARDERQNTDTAILDPETMLQQIGGAFPDARRGNQRKVRVLAPSFCIW